MSCLYEVKTNEGQAYFSLPSLDRTKVIAVMALPSSIKVAPPSGTARLASKLL